MDLSERDTTPANIRDIQTAALAAAANGIVITDRSGTIIWANPSVSRLTGYSLNELIGQKTSLFRSGLHETAFYKELWDTIQAGKVWRGKVINRKKDGSLYHEEMTITPVLGSGDEIINYIAIKEDVTAIHQANEALAASEERFRRLINTVHAHFYSLEYSADKTLSRRYLSDNFDSLTGYPNDHFDRDWTFWRSILHPDDLEKYNQTRTRVTNGASIEIEYRIIRSDGQVIWVSDNAQVHTEEDGHILVFATILDITERKETEEHIRFLATHDPLTELPNRILFREILEHSLQYAGRTEQKLGVFFLDVDDFKSVNDTYGHHIGDELLKSIAGRLTNNLRESDTVARISGDEFTLIMEQLNSREDAIHVAQKVVDFLSGKYQIREHSLNITISVGGAVFPDHGHDFETLLQRADAAMYQAKQAPGNRIRIFEPNTLT
jgi:diguanylate cyclase (GGDEF)-like protein/PAS domain S-box-containing protein